jgi:membrane-bound ClpP family serine protease
MMGEQGRALTAIGAEQPGQVSVHGEIWRAVSTQPISAGAAVRVIALTGLTAVVEPVAAAKENLTS